MNENNPTLSPADGQWPNGDHRMRVPDTSLLPGSETAPPAAVSMLKSAVQGAHKTLDRIAGSAEPAVRQLGQKVSAAKESLQATTDQLRDKRDEWAEGLRGTVRSNPLAAVATAVALGALIAHFTRNTRNTR